MASKKIIIGVVVVVIVVVAVFAMAGSSTSEPDARYDYTATLSDSIPGDVLDVPDEGYQFLLIDFILANDGWENGISTNLMYCNWSAFIDGLTYSDSSWLSVSHPDYHLVDIGVGSMAYSGAVIEIPDDATLDDIEITFEYVDFLGPNFVRDDSLM